MRLLVVEDETKMAALLKRGLEQEGYAVDIASTGKDAIWMATDHPFDAILLDVMLPDFDGFEVCRRVREAEVWAPVLMLTARDGVNDRVAGLDAGADDYLPKPFSFSELLARLRALLRRGAPERPTVLQVDDIEMDPSRRLVTRGGVKVDLTAKEFALFELFMRNPDEVLSRMRIIESVWDFGYEGGSNVVDVHIRLLRDKIDRPFGRGSIETVRGAGYRLSSAKRTT